MSRGSSGTSQPDQISPAQHHRLYLVPCGTVCLTKRTNKKIEQKSALNLELGDKRSFILNKMIKMEMKL